MSRQNPQIFRKKHNFFGSSKKRIDPSQEFCLKQQGNGPLINQMNLILPLRRQKRVFFAVISLEKPKIRLKQAVIRPAEEGVLFF